MTKPHFRRSSVIKSIHNNVGFGLIRLYKELQYVLLIIFVNMFDVLPAFVHLMAANISVKNS